MCCAGVGGEAVVPRAAAARAAADTVQCAGAGRAGVAGSARVAGSAGVAHRGDKEAAARVRTTENN